MTRIPRKIVTRALLSAAALASFVTPAVGQGGGDRPDAPLVLVTGWSGFSMREGQSTFRFADDLVTYGLRVTWNRYAAADPWLQGDRFVRPDLVCSGDGSCNQDGFLFRVGANLPFTEDDTRPGFHPRFVAAVGVGFSEITEFSYLLGLGATLTLHPRLAPVFEVRWERVPGLSNTIVLGLGLRTGIL